MKKIVILIAVLAIAATLLLTGCTTTPVNAYDEQVLTFSSATKNFNYTGENEDVKTDWTFEAGNGASTSSVFSTSANGLKINTQNAGYAVEPDPGAAGGFPAVCVAVSGLFRNHSR